ncbi:MAG: Asp23/Gls24 family envelope stress response protein [Bacillota bacterium]
MSGNEIESGIGKVILSEEVIATIAGVAATECYGIVGMSSRKVADGLAELLGRENLARGVEVNLDGDRVTIALNIVIGYGTRIPEVARNVVEKVKYTVESSTGLKVARVRVNVQGVRVNPR